MNIDRKLELLDQRIAESKAGFPDDFAEWQLRTESVVRNVLGEESSAYRDFRQVQYSASFYFSGMDDSGFQPSGVQEAIRILRVAKEELLLVEELSLTAVIEQTGTDTDAATTPRELGQRVFIIHGHDGQIKHELARALLGFTGTAPTILHEQANSGQALIEKFEASAGVADYAVVLLTADDLGRAKGDESERARARQNVVFEMGFFFAALGRERVAVLVEEGVDGPGDIRGLVYIPLDPAGAWKMSLARELQAGGLTVNWAHLGV